MSKEPMSTRRNATILTVFREAQQERILRIDLAEMGAAFGQVMLDRISRRDGRQMAVIADLAEYRRKRR